MRWPGSMTGWLVVHCGMAHARAHSLLIRARRLRELPVTAAAWRAREITDGHVELIMQTIKPAVQHLFADAESAIVPCLAELSVVDAKHVLREWAARAEATHSNNDEHDESDQTAHFSTLLDGRAPLDADLNAESAAIISEALRAARTKDSDAEPARTPGQRTADALTDICRFSLTTQRSLQTQPRPNVLNSATGHTST